MPRDVITRRPVSPQMVLIGARRLWDDVADDEGKMPWDEAPNYAQEPYVRQAQRVLEAAMPQDAEKLAKLQEEIERVREIL